MVFRMIHVKDYIPTKGQAVWSTWTSWVHVYHVHLPLDIWMFLVGMPWRLQVLPGFHGLFFTSHSFKSQMQVLNGNISKVIPWILWAWSDRNSHFFLVKHLESWESMKIFVRWKSNLPRNQPPKIQPLSLNQGMPLFVRWNSSPQPSPETCAVSLQPLRQVYSEWCVKAAEIILAARVASPDCSLDPHLEGFFRWMWLLIWGSTDSTTGG